MPTPILEYVSQTCQRYNIARSYLYRLIGEGKIEAVKDGNRTKIIVASADAHFASLPKAKIKAAKRPKTPAVGAIQPKEGA
jgi:excisionase family DNA binding protein